MTHATARKEEKSYGQEGREDFVRAKYKYLGFLMSYRYKYNCIRMLVFLGLNFAYMYKYAEGGVGGRELLLDAKCWYKQDYLPTSHCKLKCFVTSACCMW